MAKQRKVPWGSVGKWVGLAGLAGVAATGAVLARDERQRRAYSPDDVRARLHERAATAGDQPEPPPALAPATGAVARGRARVRQLVRRIRPHGL